MVQRSLPGITMDELAAAQKRAIQVTNELTSQGRPVRYIRSTFAMGEDTCTCLFEAPDMEIVREANVIAGIPFERIVLIVD
jgi:hypothetical protein